MLMLSEIWFMRGGIPGVCPVVRHGIPVGMCGTRLLTQYGSREGVRVLRSPSEACLERFKDGYLTSLRYGSVTSQ